MTEPSLSKLAVVLRPVSQAAFRHASRLHAERSGVRTPYEENLLEHTFNDTLDRLRGGNITDTWWQNLLTVLGHHYIKPEFLRVHAVQEWIVQKTVGDDLKTLAANIVMIGSGQKSEERKRLALSYSNSTGEDLRRADGVIDVFTGILVAGYIASIPASQRPLAGMVQQLHGAFNERLDNLEENHLNALTELVTQRFPIVQQLLTPYAERELSEILSLRALDQIGVRKRIQNLFKRVSEGDLSAIEESTKYKVYRWTARLCATQAETLPLAKKILLIHESPLTDALFLLVSKSDEVTTT